MAVVEPKTLYGTRGVQGNAANFLLDASGNPAGASCLSDTLNLKTPCWVRCNVAGTLRVTMAGDDDGTSVTIFMQAGVAYEGLIKRLWQSTTTVGAGDIVLLY